MDKKDKKLIYLDNLINSIDSLIKTNEYDMYKKIVFYGVKYFKYKDSYDNELDVDSLESKLKIMNFIHYSVSKLTPLDFQRIFPIKKDYDGKKYGWKDYFYTKEYIESVCETVVIGDKVDDFLWEYSNDETRCYLANCMSVIDDIRKLNRQMTMAEKFVADNNITTYSVVDVNKKDKIVINRKTGKCQKVKRKYDYLKVIK